ncbi:MAG: TetR/AcrR family transcriptional regulator [Porticoccaceae bacterium]|nr:TetR/AcrR family transcriptional regulator [Porticoccaceae bacterium]
MNLRATNKAKRQRLIVSNAARLFSSTGYDLTTIELVAARSNVSPATIYNNFENKIGLLLAVLIEEGEGVQQIGQKIIDQRTENNLSVIYRLIALYVDHPMEFMNKSCWRQALAASSASSHKKFTQEYQNVDKQLQVQLIELMHQLYNEYVFRTEVDPQSLGEIIWNNVDQMFTDFISDEKMSLEALKNTLNRQTEALLTLAQKQD